MDQTYNQKMSIKIIQEQRAKNVREQKRQQRYVTCKKNHYKTDIWNDF